MIRAARPLLGSPHEPTSPADRPPAHVYYYLIHTLRRALPESPAKAPNTRRDNALIARIAALRPANPVEADIATDYARSPPPPSSKEPPSIETEPALIRRLQPALNDPFFTEHVAQAYVAERHELSDQLYRVSAGPPNVSVS